MHANGSSKINMQPHISSLASTDSSINQVEVLRTCEELIKQFERINHKQFEVKWRHSQGLGLVENYNYNPFRKSLVLQTSNSCKPSRFSIISLAHLTKLLELSEVDNEFFQVCINGSPFQHQKEIVSLIYLEENERSIWKQIYESRLYFTNF